MGTTGNKERSMSRMYEITVTVCEFDITKKDAILDAISGTDYVLECSESYSSNDPPILEIEDFLSSVSGGTDDESIALDIARAIWKAHGGWCDATVWVKDMDSEIPTFSWDKDEYEDHKDG